MMGRKPSAWGCSLLLGAIVFSVPSTEAADTSVRLANLTQDMAILNRQVALLRSEMESLRRENAQLKATFSQGNSRDSVSREDLRTFAEAVDRELASLRKEFVLGDAKFNKELLTKVNAKLEEHGRKIMTHIAALEEKMKANRTPKVHVAQVKHPTTGIVYTVQSGDTLSRIARKHSSTVPWIKAANSIVEDTSLQIGREVFVPQNN